MYHVQSPRQVLPSRRFTSQGRIDTILDSTATTEGFSSGSSDMYSRRFSLLDGLCRSV